MKTIFITLLTAYFTLCIQVSAAEPSLEEQGKAWESMKKQGKAWKSMKTRKCMKMKNEIETENEIE